MPLSNYNPLINDFEGYLKVYEKKYASYTSDNYTNLIDIEFTEQSKDPMAETVEEIKFLILSSHIHDENLSESQIMQGMSIIKRFEEIHDRHRELKAISQQIELKNDIKEIQKTQEEVVNIKNNLFNIFSFMIGLLGFIFINFNIFNNIGQFSIEKIMTTIFLINCSFVSGIIILMSMFRELFFNKTQDKKIMCLFIVKYFLANFVLIIFLSFLPNLKNWAIKKFFSNTNLKFEIPEKNTELKLKYFTDQISD